MSGQRVGYRGYVTCRPFGGLHIPVPLQTLAMRDYCARKNLMFKLHVNENVFPHSYIVLEGLVKELDIYEGILATSMFMLPERSERRRLIYDQILQQDSSLHFILEDYAITSPDDIEPIEEILTIARLLPLTPAPSDIKPEQKSTQ